MYFRKKEFLKKFSHHDKCLTPWSRVLLEKLIAVELVKVPHFKYM
jgi:hypothetical protein